MRSGVSSLSCASPLKIFRIQQQTLYDLTIRFMKTRQKCLDICAFPRQLCRCGYLFIHLKYSGFVVNCQTKYPSEGDFFCSNFHCFSTIFSHCLWKLFSNRTRLRMVSEKKFFAAKNKTAQKNASVPFCFVLLRGEDKMKKDCLLLSIRIPGQYYRSKAKSISNSLSFRSVEIKPPEHIRFRTRKRAIGSQRLCAVRPLDAQLRILHVEGCQQRLNGRQSVRAQ